VEYQVIMKLGTIENTPLKDDDSISFLKTLHEIQTQLRNVRKRGHGTDEIFDIETFVRLKIKELDAIPPRK
jgi:hypothetical protein